MRWPPPPWPSSPRSSPRGRSRPKRKVEEEDRNSLTPGRSDVSFFLATSCQNLQIEHPPKKNRKVDVLLRQVQFKFSCSYWKVLILCTQVKFLAITVEYRCTYIHTLATIIVFSHKLAQNRISGHNRTCCNRISNSSIKYQLFLKTLLMQQLNVDRISYLVSPGLVQRGALCQLRLQHQRLILLRPGKNSIKLPPSLGRRVDKICGKLTTLEN